MYIENIYDEWKLHQDATHLEINYNFLLKFIDILDVEILSKTIDDKVVNIDNQDIIREWKILQIDKLLEQFKAISNLDFNDNKWFIHSKIFVKSIFIAGYILNSLKNINYKASELNALYEPKLFIYAEKYLDLDLLEEWISMLSKRVFDLKNDNLNSTKIYDWTLSTDITNLKNVTWYIENLLINFHDITIWFNSLKNDEKIFSNKKSCIINIVNHMIVYSLTDFYVKYYTEITKGKYLKIYQQILSEIAIDVSNYAFAITSFKQISLFLNFLLNKKIIKSNDTMISNYLNFINICCSENNINLLKNMLLKIDVKSKNMIDNDNNSDSYIYTDEGIPNQDTNPIELSSFENYKAYKTALLKPDDQDKKDTVEIPTVSFKTTTVDAPIEHKNEKNNIIRNFTKPLQTFKNIFNSGEQKNNNFTIKDNDTQEVKNKLINEEVDEYE